MTVWDLPAVPARILVKGASSTVHVAPAAGGRTEQVYAWWLKPLLEAAGLRAEVRNAGVEGQKITQALCGWNEEVERWSPDIVILNYGQYESMPGLLPYWLERHATGWHRHSGRGREWYRRRILKPVWRRLAHYQRVIDPWMSRPGPFRSSQARTIAEMDRLVAQIRQVGNPLVIVMDTWPIASPWREWFPGMEARAEAIGMAIREWATRQPSDGVRLFRLSDLVTAHGPDESLPDGVHFSAGMHRLIAEALAAEILPWAATQPHLGHPDMDLHRYSRSSRDAPEAEEGTLRRFCRGEG